MREAANEVVLQGQGPFEGLRKLLNGFCDPWKAMNDDDDEPGSSIKENHSIQAHTKAMETNSTDDSERKAPSVADTSVDSKIDSEIYQRDEELKDGVDEEELFVEEGNSFQGTSVRSARRSQVVLFAFAAVMLTIYALSSMGFTMDFIVIESPRTAAEPMNIINIGMAAKKEAPADTALEHTQIRDAKALESLKALKDLVAEIKEL